MSAFPLRIPSLGSCLKICWLSNLHQTTTLLPYTQVMWFFQCRELHICPGIGASEKNDLLCRISWNLDESISCEIMAYVIVWKIRYNHIRSSISKYLRITFRRFKCVKILFNDLLGILGEILRKRINYSITILEPLGSFWTMVVGELLPKALESKRSQRDFFP